MSITSNRIHRRIEWLVAQANDFLPDDVHLGYALQHTHQGDGSVISDAELIRADADLKRMMRRDLALRIEKGWSGADVDFAALNPDAQTIGDVDVIFELFHIPTRISVIRTVRLATLRNLATDDTKTNEEKRQIVRTQLTNFYQELLARLPSE